MWEVTSSLYRLHTPPYVSRTSQRPWLPVQRATLAPYTDGHVASIALRCLHPSKRVKCSCHSQRACVTCITHDIIGPFKDAHGRSRRVAVHTFALSTTNAFCSRTLPAWATRPESIIPRNPALVTPARRALLDHAAALLRRGSNDLHRGAGRRAARHVRCARSRAADCAELAPVRSRSTPNIATPLGRPYLCIVLLSSRPRASAAHYTLRSVSLRCLHLSDRDARPPTIPMAHIEFTPGQVDVDERRGEPPVRLCSGLRSSWPTTHAPLPSAPGPGPEFALSKRTGWLSCACSCACCAHSIHVWLCVRVSPRWLRHRRGRMGSAAFCQAVVPRARPHTQKLSRPRRHRATLRGRRTG